MLDDRSSLISSASADVGTSVLRPIFTVRSPPRCISRYKVDLLMPSDRAASRGDIAIGVFILGGCTFLSSALNRGSRSAPLPRFLCLDYFFM